MAAFVTSTQVSAMSLPSLAVSTRSKVARATSSKLSFTCASGLPRSNANRLSWEAQTQCARGSARTTCLAPPLVISLSTGAVLFLGRFVFLPFQRSQVTKAGLPVQNGVTHFEAGDSRAQEVVGFLKTNDPAGFTLVDVLGWGAIGHAIGYFILATASNGYDPTF